MNIIRRNVRVNERVGVRTRDTILNSVTMAEIAADIEKQIARPVIDLARVSNGLKSMIGSVLDSLQPEQRAKVLQDITDMSAAERIEQTHSGAAAKDSLRTAREWQDASRTMRQMRDATGSVCDAINKANRDFYAKQRGA